jgi:TonB family protein
MAELIQSLNVHAPDILRTLGVMELQIAILALLVLAIERLLRQPLPKVRYALWLIVLVKCLLPPFVPMPQAVHLPMTQFELPAILTNVTAPQTQTLSFATIFLILWATASLVFGVLALRRYWLLRGQLRDIQPLPLQELFENDAIHSSWPPIWQTANLPTPVAMGLLHPRIYLNSTAANSDRKALQAVLYHELAHVRHYDGWIVLLQTIAQILHPFNPLVWLMNIRLSHYREEICDDFALQHATVQPCQYGEMLLRFLEASATSQFWIRSGTCFFETAEGFKQRLKYLLSPKEAVMNRFTWKHKLLLVGMLLALLAVSWQCSQENTPPSAPPSPVQRQMSTAPSDTPPVEYDIAPQLIKRVEPPYPDLARKAGIEGRAIIKILIQENGQVGDVKVVECSHPNGGFEEAAIAAAKEWVFSPAKKGGKPIAVWSNLTFKFKLKE